MELVISRAWQLLALLFCFDQIVGNGFALTELTVAPKIVLGSSAGLIVPTKLRVQAGTIFFLINGAKSQDIVLPYIPSNSTSELCSTAGLRTEKDGGMVALRPLAPGESMAFCFSSQGSYSISFQGSGPFQKGSQSVALEVFE